MNARPRRKPAKSPEAYRTIGEAAAETGLPPHVLRFWEAEFTLLRPVTGAGGRRFYRPRDLAAARALQRLLHIEGYTLKGAKRLIAVAGAKAVLEAYGGAPAAAHALNGDVQNPALALQNTVRSAAAAGLFGAVVEELGPAPPEAAGAPVASYAQARLARLLAQLNTAQARLDRARRKA